MAEGRNGEHNVTIDEETKTIRKIQEEKFCGKLSENDVRCLLQLNNWDQEAAFKDFCESDIKELREKICDGNLDKVVSLKRDTVLRALEDKTDTGKPKGAVKRQYACGACDRVWWYRTPTRKQVSTCRVCRVTYDAVPVDRMFGWAIFECECGNEFSGFGQMGVTASQCYVSKGGCGKMVYPSKVNPPDYRHGRKSRAQHSCNAPDCIHRTDGRAYARGGPRGSTDRPNRPDSEGRVSKCVHPKSRELSADKKKVLYSSSRHISTGSTVATYLTQDDQISVTSSYIASLDTVQEEN